MYIDKARGPQEELIGAKCQLAITKEKINHFMNCIDQLFVCNREDSVRQYQAELLKTAEPLEQLEDGNRQEVDRLRSMPDKSECTFSSVWMYEESDVDAISNEKRYSCDDEVKVLLCFLILKQARWRSSSVVFKFQPVDHNKLSKKKILICNIYKNCTPLLI